MANWTRLQIKRMPNGGISTYRDGVYCGPGWGFVRQDVESGRLAELPEAFDAIDAACKRHDQCYQDHGWFTRECNVALASNLARVVVSYDATPQMRVDATIMAAIFELEANTVDLGALGYRRVRAQIEFEFAVGRTMLWILEQQLKHAVQRFYY